MTSPERSFSPRLRDAARWNTRAEAEKVLSEETKPLTLIPLQIKWYDESE